MRYGAEHKQETRARVLTEAAKAIRADGPHRIGVAEVMGRAGLTHGGFYAHFNSKDDLVAAAIDRMVEEGRERMVRETFGKSPCQALSDYVDFYLSPAHRDMRTTGCPLPFLSADAPRLSDTAQVRFAAGVENLTTGLAEQLRLMGRPDAEADAASMIAELVGALSLARAQPDPLRSDAILARSRAAVKHRLGLESAS